MSLIARITDFAPGTVIASQPFDDEFNQLVNALSGVSQNKSIRVISNDNAFAAGRFDQRGNNDILQLYGDGAEVFGFEKDGDIRSPHLNSVGGVYTFVAIPVGPASNPTLANQFARKQYVDDTTVTKSITIGTEQDPNLTNGATEAGRFSYFVPDGNALTIVGLAIKFQEGSHTAGAGNVLSYTVRIRNQNSSSLTDLGPISLNDTNNTLHRTYILAVGPHVLADFDSITYFKSTLTGTITERSVSLGVLVTEKRI